jgi:hypothetical protein
LQILLDNKGDVFESTGVNEYTALHYAINASSLKKEVGLASQLLSCVASNKIISNSDSNNNNKLEKLDITNAVPTLKNLLAAGSYPNYRTNKGKTPLQLISENIKIWGLHISYAVTTLILSGARMDESVECNLLREKCIDLDFEVILEQWNSNSVPDADFIGLKLNSLQNNCNTIRNTNIDGKETCSLCSFQFTLFKRQHHCRMCSILCCDDCSRKRVFVDFDQVRCCDSCFNIIQNKINIVKQRSIINSIKPYKQNKYNSNDLNDIKDKNKLDLLSNSNNRDSLRINIKERNNRNRSTSSSNNETSSNLSGTVNLLNETKDKLLERGEKLNQLSDKSADLSNAANEFAKMARQLNQQQKSWF